jgi:septum formation topological specificity factor MinE
MELYNGLQFLIMKYIITESRVEKVIFKYLDIKLEGIELKEGRYDDTLILVFPGEEYGLMGWDKPNKLYTYYKVIDDIENMFSMEEDDVLDVIGRYVESRYNLKVKRNEIAQDFDLRPLKVDE